MLEYDFASVLDLPWCDKSNVSYAGLAGATADVHCYDVLSNKWSRW